jgi:hypothetical protein
MPSIAASANGRMSCDGQSLTQSPMKTLRGLAVHLTTTVARVSILGKVKDRRNNFPRQKVFSFQSAGRTRTNFSGVEQSVKKKTAANRKDVALDLTGCELEWYLSPIK